MSDVNPFDFSTLSDIEAEQAVIGCMLMDKASVALAMGLIKSADFYDPRHAIIFECVTSIDHAAYGSEYVDMRLVRDQIRTRNCLNAIGGIQYVGELSEGVVSFSHLDNHCAIVRNHAAVRRAMEKLTVLQVKARSGHHDPMKLSSELASLAVDLTSTNTSRPTEHVRDVLLGMWDDIGKEPVGALTWHHPALTQRFGTLLPTETVLVSAEPAAGKSSLVLQLAVHVAAKHGPVLYFVFEMSKAEMGRRIIAQATGVDESKILGRVPFSPGDESKILDEGQRIAETPLRISDDTSVTLSRMRAEIQREKAAGDVVMVVIDYLQLVVCENLKANRVEQIDELSRGIKKMAQDFGVVVVVVSSLNDTGDQAGAPKLRNLRGSRQLGFDANKVFMLSNDGDDFDTDEPPPIRDVLMTAGKNRGGAKGAKCRLRFHGPTYSFTVQTDDMEQPWHAEPPTRGYRAPVRSVPSPRESMVTPIHAPRVDDGTGVAEDYFAGRDASGLPGAGDQDHGELFDGALDS